MNLALCFGRSAIVRSNGEWSDVDRVRCRHLRSGSWVIASPIPKKYVQSFPNMLTALLIVTPSKMISFKLYFRYSGLHDTFSEVLNGTNIHWVTPFFSFILGMVLKSPPIIHGRCVSLAVRRSSYKARRSIFLHSAYTTENLISLSPVL